jgi:hypothetical protein
MVYVNDFVLYSLLACFIQEVVGLGLFGNWEVKGYGGQDHAASYRRTIAGLMFLMCWLIPAGMYVVRNLPANMETASDSLQYQSARHVMSYVQYMFFIVGFIFMQGYKAMARKDSKQYETGQEPAGYEIRAIPDKHKESDGTIWYADNTIRSLVSMFVFIAFLADTTMMMLVLLHSRTFSVKGTAATTQYYEIGSAVVGFVAVAYTALGQGWLQPGRNIYCFNTAAKLSDYHLPSEAYKPENGGCKVDLPMIPTMRLLMVKVSPNAILVHSFMSIAFAFIFHNNYASFMLFVAIRVVYPLLASARVKTFGAWMQYYMLSGIVYYFIFFMIPAFHVMKKAPDAVIVDSFLVATTGEGAVDRPFDLAREYQFTAQTYRTSWTTDFKLTSLSQTIVLVYMCVYAAALVFLDLPFMGGGNAILPSGASIIQNASARTSLYFHKALSVVKAVGDLEGQ